MNNHEDASDLAQDAFVKAYKAIGRFRGDSAFSTWLYRIAVNTCLNFRSARRLAQEELSETLADPDAPVVQRMQERERSRAGARGGDAAAGEAAGDLDPEDLP